MLDSGMCDLHGINIGINEPSQPINALPTRYQQLLGIMK